MMFSIREYAPPIGLALARRVLPIGLLCFLAPAFAGEPEDWQFVYVNRSTDLNVTSGHATLKQEGSRLSGRLVGEQHITFFFEARMADGTVTAVFGAIGSDDGGTRLTGTFREVTIGTSCWQTVQLSDGFSSLALARNALSCKL